MTQDQFVKCSKCGHQHQVKDRIPNLLSKDFLKEVGCPICASESFTTLRMPDEPFVSKAIEIEPFDLSTMQRSDMIAVTCPGCGKVLDCVTGPNDTPQPGHLIVTLCCAIPCEYTKAGDGLALRELTREDIGMLPEEVAFKIGVFIGTIQKVKAANP